MFGFIGSEAPLSLGSPLGCQNVRTGPVASCPCRKQRVSEMSWGLHEVVSESHSQRMMQFLQEYRGSLYGFRLCVFCKGICKAIR